MLLTELEKFLQDKLKTKYTFCYWSDISKDDNTITLAEYGGKALGDFTTAASRYIQIKLRNANAQGGYKDIWHLYNSMVTSTEEYRNGDFWMQYSVHGVPLNIGMDKNNRQQFTLNVKIFTDNKEE